MYFVSSDMGFALLPGDDTAAMDDIEPGNGFGDACGADRACTDHTTGELAAK